jgi:Flp pilus assembly protein TadG
LCARSNETSPKEIAHLDEEMNPMLRGGAVPSGFRGGGVMPLTVLSLSLLAGVVALAVDGGTLMEARRHVQAAADAAALAGATDFYANYPANQGLDLYGTAQSSALSVASANGFSNDGVQSSVTVRVAPQQYLGGPYASQTIPPGYIEVTIQYNASHLFSGIFGTGVTPVRARAVARGRTVPMTYNGVIALSLQAAGALQTSGLAGLKVNGGIQVSSSNTQALEVSGTLGITATSITTTLNASLALPALSSLLFSPSGGAPTTIVARHSPDPLRFLTPPDPVSLGLSTRGTNLSIGSGAVDLYPGVYLGGINISGTATVTLHANSDGTPGIYYMQGSTGFQVSGSANVTTATGETGGILIYNDWSASTDSIQLATSGTISLMPPASGPYLGLSLFQKRGTPLSPAPPLTLNGQGNFTLTGTVYAAHAAINLYGSSSTNVMAGQIIADTISVGGTAQVNINSGNGVSQTTAGMRVIGLVE